MMLLLAALTETVTLKYVPSPADNPLKGLVPYQAPAHSFPHSLEFDYFPLRKLNTGPDQYDWTSLDRFLNSVASRGNQAIFRVYLEYPGRESGIPEYLERQGVKSFTYPYGDSNAVPKPTVTTPDYRSPALQTALVRFILALGKRYDGDPRIGFITAGLLGYWGEWHTYPREDLWASKLLQSNILDAYEQAFRKTHILLRYPAGADDPQKAKTAGRRFGYHDDSFAWATFDTAKEDSWYFLAAMRRAGPSAQSAWQNHPIGGEVRPELWGIVHDPKPAHLHAQDFRQCVEQTHATWLMDSGVFRANLTKRQRGRAIESAQQMGYDLHVSRVTFNSGLTYTDIRFTIENRGVAPFYYPWRLNLITEGDQSRTQFAGTIEGILPGQPSAYRVRVPSKSVAVAKLRVQNPLAKGKPLRFANEPVLMDAEGTLTILRRDLSLKEHESLQ